MSVRAGTSIPISIAPCAITLVYIIILFAKIAGHPSVFHPDTLAEHVYWPGIYYCWIEHKMWKS